MAGARNPFGCGDLVPDRDDVIAAPAACALLVGITGSVDDAAADDHAGLGQHEPAGRAQRRRIVDGDRGVAADRDPSDIAFADLGARDLRKRLGVETMMHGRDATGYFAASDAHVEPASRRERAVAEPEQVGIEHRRDLRRRLRIAQHLAALDDDRLVEHQRHVLACSRAQRRSRASPPAPRSEPYGRTE